MVSARKDSTLEYALRERELGSPERYEIVLVGERHDTFAIFFRHREEVLQCIPDTFAQFGAEVLEDKMWVLL